MNKPLTTTIKELLLFASPIAIGQLSQMLIGAGDVIIASRHGRETVAAIGIANSISAPVFLIGIGLLLGISPILSKKRGEESEVKHYLHTCTIYSLFISIVFISLTMATIPLVEYLGFEKNLIPHIKDYLFLVSFSYIGAYLFHAIKEYLQAMEHVVFANSVSVFAIFANLGLNYVLVFGVMFFPELGVKGLAYATIIVRSLMGISLLIYARRYSTADFKIIKNFAKHVFKFSLPISMSIFIEVLAFSIIMILNGRLSSLYAAIHSISLTLASTTYMIPLAVSSATSVKIGYFYGRRNFKKIHSYMKASMIISMTFMALAGLSLYIFPDFILSLFTKDQELVILGGSILMVCAMFQIFDGAQVTLSGILRGVGITKPTFIIVALGYWLIGLPLGYYLGYTLKLNTLGFWIGLAFSLLAISISLFIYLRSILHRIEQKLSN